MLPTSIIQISPGNSVYVGLPTLAWPFATNVSEFEVMVRSRTLKVISQGGSIPRNGPQLGFFHRVQVIPSFQGLKKLKILFFYSWLDQLKWDPSSHEWNIEEANSPLLEFTTKMGRKLL